MFDVMSQTKIHLILIKIAGPRLNIIFKIIFEIPTIVNHLLICLILFALLLDLFSQQSNRF